MDIVIMDLDGVLCDNSHRAHLVPPADQHHRNEAWRPFVAECVNDAPIAAGIAMYHSLLKAERNIVVITSRQDRYFSETYGWYRDHLAKCPDTIFRPDDCHLPPVEYKKWRLQQLASQGYNILFAIDDDPAIVAMYNAEGVPTFQPSTRCSSCK